MHGSTVQGVSHAAAHLLLSSLLFPFPAARLSYLQKSSAHFLFAVLDTLLHNLAADYSVQIQNVHYRAMSAHLAAAIHFAPLSESSGKQ